MKKAGRVLLYAAAVLAAAGRAAESPPQGGATPLWSPLEEVLLPQGPAGPKDVPRDLGPRDYARALDGAPVPLSRSDVAALVYTGNDLRAMGIHSLAELFRYVPGVDVFQLNGFTYAAGIRRADDEFNPRLQVYLDGRLVNVPEFGGVDWENIAVSIEDIDRIEIVRAAGVPGEAGSAMDGAVRIWTKRPRQGPPLLYSGYFGSQRTQIHVGRVVGGYGPVSTKAAIEYRGDNGVAGQALSGLGVIFPQRVLDDGRRLLKFNVAGVWELDEMTDLDLRFTGTTGRLGETGGDPISNGRTNTDSLSVGGEFRKRFENDARVRAGYYFEDCSLEFRNHPSAPLHGAGDHIDLDRCTHAFYGAARVPLSSFLDLTGGAGWKQDRLRYQRNAPRKDNQEILHADLGGEVRPAEALTLRAGLHLENDLFAGLDVSPAAGAAYSVLPDHTVRLSYRVGRRKPNLWETDTAFLAPNPLPPPAGLPLVTGNRDVDRETVQAYEAGYRGIFRDLRLLADLQIFVHELKDKVVFVPDPASPVPGALTFDNAGEERACGAELLLDWNVYGPLSLYGTYTFQNVEDTRTHRLLRNHPRHKANFGLRLDFESAGISAFANLNYTSEIDGADVLGDAHAIGDRFRLDLRIAKSLFRDRIEVGIIARNVLDDETLESRPALGSNWNGDFGAERAVLFNVLIRL